MSFKFYNWHNRSKPGRKGAPGIKTPSVEGICIPPRPFHFIPDFTSSILYYDESGRPKRYIPSTQLPNGEWSYSLSPKRSDGPLSGIALSMHLLRLEALLLARSEAQCPDLS